MLFNVFVFILLLSASCTGQIDDREQNHFHDPDELNVSAIPTKSVAPSPVPTTLSRTERPSNIPSSKPTLSLIPSAGQVVGLTALPSDTPSFATSLSPSLQPVQNQQQPTQKPTKHLNQPTAYATKSPVPQTPFLPTSFPTSLGKPSSETKPPSVSPLNDQSVDGGGIGIGMITALGVSGLALFVTAAIFQRRRMMKGLAQPEIVSTFSDENHDV